MKLRVLVATAFCIAACGKTPDATKSKTKPESKPSGETISQTPSTDTEKMGDTDVSSQPSAVKVTDPRQQLLREELDSYSDKEIRHDAASLSAGEKLMLGNLFKAGQIIDDLYMLQLHPENLAWRDTVNATGTPLEKRLFARNRMPWCEDNDSPDCTALPLAGAKKIGAVFWPEGFDDVRYKQLPREINAKELLSPFTVVRDKEPRGFSAIPFAGFDLFAPRMRELSRVLTEAAKGAPSPTLKQFLISRASAFSSLKPFPYDDSDYDWIGLSGDWEVTLGPYETYRSPFQTKALFEMVIAREDAALTASLAALKRDMQNMENALSVLVGENLYKPRRLDPRISVRAVDVWAAFGDARHSRGAVLAYHLPNRGKSVDEGVYKKVILVNHAQAMEAVTEARAALILDPSQQAMLSFRDSITNTAFHELSHGFGAHHEMRITDREGRLTTVKEALREYDSLLEELKADMLGLWLSKMQHDNGALDEASLHRRYVSSVVHLLGLLQYPSDDTYTQMAATALGRLMDGGAVIWDADAGRASVVFDKMGSVLTELVKDTAVMQLTGDYAGAAATVGRYVSMDGKTSSLKDAPAAVKSAVTVKFKAAALKSPSLKYKVVGL